MMAGAYVGVGIMLILALGNDADPASRNLIMGCFFGIALALIIFAGAELLARAVICNWLLCLSIWMTSKTTSDPRKMYPHLLVPVCVCLRRFRTQHREHDNIHPIAPW